MRLVFKAIRVDGAIKILGLAESNLCNPEEFLVTYEVFTPEDLKARDATIARKAFQAGRRDKQGCVVNIDYGDKGLGAFEYPRVDDYLRAEGLLP